MKHFLKEHRKTRLAAIAGTLGVVAATALSAWLADGDGNARGKSQGMQPLVVAQGTHVPTGSEMMNAPGDTGAALFDVQNANDVPVALTGISAAATPQNGDPLEGWSSDAGCPPDEVTVQNVTTIDRLDYTTDPPTVMAPVVPANTSISVRAAGGLRLSDSASQACASGVEFRKGIHVVAVP